MWKNRRANIVNRFSTVALSAFLMLGVVVGPLATPAVAAACSVPLGADQASRSATVKAVYQDWKATYVTQNGAGGDLRVQRAAFDNYDTVSEGIAYGMLFAVYNSDKPTFDGLWAYAQKHVNANGVMNWRIGADGSTLGFNGATDADEDIAAALVAADTAWGGYRVAALKQIDIVRRFQVEAASAVLKPGDVWGGSDLLNASYIAPAYYDVFQTYTGNTDWSSIKAANYRVLRAAQNSTTGLIPDWSNANGGTVSGMSHNYGYDASRAPLRLAMSAAWQCDNAAVSLLAPFNAWSQKQDISKLASSYSLDGSIADRGDGTPLLAAAAAGATTSQSESYRASVWNALTTATGSSYYPESMRLFGLMIANGTMVSPLEIPQRQAVATTAPTSYEITGVDAAITVGETTNLSLTFKAPETRKDLLVDLELYDSSNRKVAQQVYEQQTLSTAGTNLTLNWKATATGTYTLKAGIFKAGWAQNFKWNDKAATVAVNLAPVAPTPVPAPVVVTPAPTPVPIVIAPVPAPAPTPVQPPTPAQPVVPAPTAPIVQPTVTPVVVTPTPPVQPTAPVQNIPVNVSIWWPGSSQAVSGVQPFKAVIDGLALSDYDMYWQVDGDQLNRMDSISDGAPHKLSMVNLDYWKWSGNNRYTINFVAKKKDGTILAQKSTTITVWH